MPEDQDIKRSVRRYRNQSMAAFLALLLGLVFVRIDDINHANDANDAIVQSTVVTGIANCNRDFRGRVEVLSVLRGSREFARTQYQNRDISKDTFDVGDKFYAERLAGLPLPDCRLIRQTITANADKLEKIAEEPLYDGAPGTEGASNRGSGGQDPGQRPSPGGGGG